MIFKIKFIRNFMISIKQYINEFDNLIKKVEYFRRLYIYPSKMIGRKLSLDKINTPVDVLVFAAHPDDEILGLSTILYRHRLKGENVNIIYVTNGTQQKGASWRIKVRETKRRCEIRYNEGIKALSMIGIPSEQIHCLGFPDGGTQRYTKSIADDIKMIMKKLKPKVVYVHCIEGGHLDHDMTSFIVKIVCKGLKISNLFEWTEYRSSQPLGSKSVKFLPSKSSLDENIINISEEEAILKKKMLALHKSQEVEKFSSHGEAIRKANLSLIEKELDNYCQLPRKKINNLIKSLSNY